MGNEAYEMSKMVELPCNWPLFGYREWHTKDGGGMQYKDIDLTHLQSIRRMLARQGAAHSLQGNAYAGDDQGGETTMDYHFEKAHGYLRHADLLGEYITWREENNYFFHAPKVEWDKTDGQEKSLGYTDTKQGQ